jgi:selenium metabolism protein YedF
MEYKMNRIDTRNNPCPAPVIMTKKALEKQSGEALTILADPGPPRENILRFARSRGFDVQEKEEHGYYLLTVSKASEEPLASAAASPCSQGVLISSDRFGDGPDELGRLLMKNFIITLLELPDPPDRIFLLNRGVLLATEGSETIEPLTKLAAAGIEIFSCGVCLDYFSVRDKLAVGAVTNMYTIAEALTSGNLNRV